MGRTDDAAIKVKSTSRRHRKVCQAKCKEDPQHVCSGDHVRVPAHCRLKRNKKKRNGKRNQKSLAISSNVQEYPDTSLLLLPAQFDGSQMRKELNL